MCRRRVLPTLAFGLLGVVGCSTSERPAGQSISPPPSQAQESVEYKLAVVDRGGYVAPDDVVVARFGSLLQQLGSKFGETPERIGDMTVACRNSLREKGVSESIVNIMEGMNRVVDAPILSSQGINMQKSPRSTSLCISCRGILEQVTPTPLPVCAACYAKSNRSCP